MSEHGPTTDPPSGPGGQGGPAGPEPTGPVAPEPEAALAEVAASSPENPEQLSTGAGAPRTRRVGTGNGGWAPGERARIIRERSLAGNSFTVTVLALFTALVVGG